MPISLDGTGSISGISTFSFSDEIIHTGDTNTAIKFPANDTISFETAGNERFRISSNGLVNIGAGSSASGLSPLLHLHKNASNSSAYFHITNNDTGITNNDGFLLGVNPSGDCLVFNKDSTPMRFATAGLERLRIDSNGNIGVNCTPSSSGGAGTLYGTVDHFIAIGDSDTGIAQDGDGQLELWTNNTEIASFNTGQVTLKKVTQINNSIGVGILPQTSGSGSQFGARTYKICIGDNDTGIAQNGDGNLCFYSNNEEIIRIDSGISGTVKNNFLLKEFTRTDNSSQHGPLSTSFSTDNNISATISNYQRGQRIIIRATVPCGIALQNGSGQNYAGTSARIKLSSGSNSTYSNDRPVWYRADGSGTHETTQNLFICLYLTESNTDFNNGDTLTVTIEGKKNSGTGTSQHYIGGWSSVKEITVERYERAL